MSKRDPAVSALERMRRPLGRFLDRVAAKLHPAITQFLQDRSLSPEQLVEEDVEERQNQLRATIAKWREFGTLRRLHDKSAMLKGRIELLDKHGTEYFNFERLLLSGAGRYVLRIVKGGTQEDAAKEIFSGYAALVRGDRCESVIGASFRTLELAQEPLNLDADTVVRRLTHEERRLTYRRGFLDYDRDREESPGLPSLLTRGAARPLSSPLQKSLDNHDRM